MADISYFTREGYEKLKEELQQLRAKDRVDISNAIAEARDKGDLSENAEYDAAKEAQGMLEMRIAKLDTLLANARVLDDTDMDTSKAYILSKVKIRNLKTKQEVTYTLVAAKEASLTEGRISVESPIGKALLGRSVGDQVEVQAPAGKLAFAVLEISR